MITQRSHQYLPRVVPSWLRASFAGASWDTHYRVSGLGLRPAVTLPAWPAVGSSHDDAVPPLIHKAAAWAWRLLVIIAFAVAVLWVIRRLELIVVPVALALMVTALMIPAVDFLDRRGAPRGGAVALVLLTGIAIVGGMLTFVVSQFVTGLPGLVDQVTQSIESTRTWLIEGPAHLSKDQITNAGNSAIEALRNNQAKLTSGALSTAATVTEIVTGALLVLFTLIFFLHGGRNIWQFVTKIFPEQRPGAGARCGPRRVSSRSSAMCARRFSSRWSTPSGSAPGSRSWGCRWRCRWPRSSSSAPSSRWSVRSSPDSSPSSSHCSQRASSTR